MSSARDKLYGEMSLIEDRSEKYRQAANQLIKEYSAEGLLDDIGSIERNGDEVTFSFENYRIRTFSVPQTNDVRNHALASNADSEEIQEVLRDLGKDVERHVEMLTE